MDLIKTGYNCACVTIILAGRRLRQKGQHRHISRSCLKQRNKQAELEQGKVEVDNFMTLNKSHDFDK